VPLRPRLPDMTSDPLSSRGRGAKSWRVAAGQTLRWRCWSGDYAVFNPLSGQTHLLDIVGGKVLALLMAGPHDIDQIRSGIATFLEVPNDDELAATIGGILMNLENVGLVEHAS
jgi:PqqD family protein of HPr-rel-A system